MLDCVYASQSEFHSIQSRELSCKVGTTRKEKETPMDAKASKSLIPTLGALHISLNAQKNVFNMYHPLMKYFYETVFPNSKLAEKPMPWRRTLNLKIIHSGWTLIRSAVT